MVNSPAQITGPGALKVGFIIFMKAVGVETNGYIDAGIYVGDENRTVTVVGTKYKHREYVDRGGFRGKMQYYRALGISHFSKSRQDWASSKGKKQMSCDQHLQATQGTNKVANY